MARIIAVAAVLVCLALAACGGGDRPGGGPTQDAATRPNVMPKQTVAERGVGGERPGADAKAVTGLQASAGRRYMNDSDNDPENDEDNDDSNGKKIDEDNDPREDHLPTQNRIYHDSDDRFIVRFGVKANAADARAVASVVARYRVAAAASDGAKACSLMYSTLAEAVVEDYGRAPGPAYLRGAQTCAELMSRLFAHLHGELTGAVDVTSVRVKRNDGFALLGSSHAPARYVKVHRERGVWKIEALTLLTLP